MDQADHSAAETSSQPHQPRQHPAPLQTAEELKEESRMVRRLQIMMNMVMQVIAQDSTMTVDEAAEMVVDTLFPDKELAFNLIYRPRLQRLMRERFRMQ
jgi:hypothetical protein